MGKGREKVEQIIWRLIGRLRRFLDAEILNRLDFTRCFEIVLVKENIGVLYLNPITSENEKIAYRSQGAGSEIKVFEGGSCYRSRQKLPKSHVISQRRSLESSSSHFLTR